MTEILRSHPRYTSLKIREQLTQAMQDGIVHETGLIAHGRGEAYDYLLGEQTIPQAEVAEKAAAATLLSANNPVISVNGNVVALVADDCIKLSEVVPAKLEINLFHRTQDRLRVIHQELLRKGATTIYGLDADACIPGLSHDRALCEKEGIFSADVVLVPLEDGDRCQALTNMGKTVIVIDLNPLSRSANTATITIVDNVTRAISNLIKWVKNMKNLDNDLLNDIITSYDNRQNITDILSFLSKRLNSLS